VRFEPNQQGIDAAVRAAAESFTTGLQQAVDDVSATHQGRPVEDVKPALRERLRQVPGATVDDPKLSEWAGYISNGRPINLSN
jgi:hypothetical protein